MPRDSINMCVHVGTGVRVRAWAALGLTAVVRVVEPEFRSQLDPEEWKCARGPYHEPPGRKGTDPCPEQTSCEHRGEGHLPRQAEEEIRGLPRARQARKRRGPWTAPGQNPCHPHETNGAGVDVQDVDGPSGQAAKWREKPGEGRTRPCPGQHAADGGRGAVALP